MKWKRWKKRKKNRYWRHLFKEKLKRVRWILFETNINEKLLEENKRKYLELQARCGLGPFL